MNKKILITSNTSWFIYNFFSSSIVEFSKYGNQIHVIAPKDKYTQKLIDLGCHYSEINIDRSGINLFSEIKALLRLYYSLSIISPDCVLNFTPKLNIYSVLCCKVLNIKVINSIAGSGAILSDSGFKSLVGRLLLRLSQPLADHIIFQNNDDLSIYLNNKFITKKKSSRVKGIGVHLKKFTPYESDNDGVVRFILFARMLKNKGVIEFLHAAEAVNEYYQTRKKAGYKIPRYHFSLLGFIDEAHPKGIPFSLLKQWDKKPFISYIGETDDVFNIVKHYDCVVLPSYYREGIPQCLIEACAMAKPIITTNNIGCKETVIDGVSGFIIQSKCVPDLKNAIVKMIELSHSQRIEMGKKGRKKAERDFCHITVSKHYMDTIQKILFKYS
ncbi:glycosyltransferase family 4 protein [Photobacterium leiognathi]|uniref:glycosyltransferase family 4 protein n=1 Tax=Photobacterium leiognathi TaxID=553611 RepID=UPI00298220CE|nr:glycosyltransferase family 4 protein [Photobacterium leiognathi]